MGRRRYNWTALSIGQCVPRLNFGGRIHSLFERACNVRLDDSALITFLAATLDDVPQGIRLDTAPSFVFDTLSLAPGQRVFCRAGQVRFADSPLRIDLRTAQVWRSDLSALSIDPSQPRVQRAVTIARQTLESYLLGWLDAPTSAQTGSAQPAMTALLDATRRLDRASACVAAERLIGLGPGLTPSGDDFLVGYLAGLWSTARRDSPRYSFLVTLGAEIANRAGRTNAISRAYLRHAAQGCVSRAIATLASAIGAGEDSASVQQAAYAALRVGHTSGAACVAGLLSGLCVSYTP
ncbi:MAG TPA: DUF2877 domain-containing protein [Anaerolineae bacterium]|nr:DUF2877 domain-containing protein [Anaerolineae bacterium]